MKERPLLYTAPMVRATLNNTKTQTRRLRGLDRINASPNDWSHPGSIGDDHNLYARFINKDGDVVDVKCPYGKPGDQLWVRETWQYADWTEDGYPFIKYEADGSLVLHERIPEDWDDRLERIWVKLSEEENYNIDKRAADRKWRPSIHHPRWASRIQLEITNIRVERLQECSVSDALAEGIKHNSMNYPPVEYRWLWESINGPGSWDANPWVWVVEFRRIKP